MTHRFADIMFTPGVQLAQESYGSREQNKRLQTNFGPNDKLTQRETEFIGARNSFYLATVTESGWPYVQHRGGPKGFLKVLDSSRLAYADFKGNTQLISTGNSAANDKCALILMDYPNRRRLKLLGKLSIQNISQSTSVDVNLIQDTAYNGKVERLAIIEVAAFDWNCPQHIERRYTTEELAELGIAKAFE